MNFVYFLLNIKLVSPGIRIISACIQNIVKNTQVLERFTKLRLNVECLQKNLWLAECINILRIFVPR